MHGTMLSWLNSRPSLLVIITEMTFPPLNEQMDAARRGAVDLIDEKELAKKIERASASGKPLVVKLGADPSNPRSSHRPRRGVA